MTDKPQQVIEGVNQRDFWSPPNLLPPQTPDQAQIKQILLVDQAGRPLLVREPRPVGFRRNR